MQKHDFQVILGGIGQITEEISNRLYDAGCDDGTPFSSAGVAAIGFSREAESMEQAVRSAVNDIQRAGYTVARVESVDEPTFARINRELARQ